MNDNARLLGQMLEQVWNTGDAESIETFYHPDYVAHYGAGREVRFDELAGNLAQLKSAFPDFHEECHDLICEGDQVVARLTMSGTQEGSHLGHPASGRSFVIASIDIYRFSDGKVIEQWGLTDIAKMAEQLHW